MIEPEHLPFGMIYAIRDRQWHESRVGIHEFTHGWIPTQVDEASSQTMKIGISVENPDLASTVGLCFGRANWPLIVDSGAKC